MGEVDMIYGKCPRCGEDDHISGYMASDGKITYWGVKCGSCGYTVKSMVSQEDAVSIWRTGGSERDLAPCPFCGGSPKLESDSHKKSFGRDKFRIVCSSCYTGTRWYDSPDEAWQMWNRRVSDW